MLLSHYLMHTDDTALFGHIAKEGAALRTCTVGRPCEALCLGFTLPCLRSCSGAEDVSSEAAGDSGHQLSSVGTAEGSLLSKTCLVSDAVRSCLGTAALEDFAGTAALDGFAEEVAVTDFADCGALKGFAGKAKTSLPRMIITLFGSCLGWQMAGDVLEAYSLASIEAHPTFTCYMDLLSHCTCCAKLEYVVALAKRRRHG